MVKKCEFCGEEFEYANPRKRFCSRDCNNKYNYRKYNESGKYSNKKICLCCNKEFIDISRKGKKYCSKECQNKMLLINNEIRTCKCCGKQFEVKPSQSRVRKAEYCSVQCRNKCIKKGSGHKYKHLILICQECGKEFRTGYDNQKFCSRECTINNIPKREKWGQERNRIKCICQICGKEFEISQHDKNNIKYCSRECSDKSKTIESFSRIVDVKCKQCGKEFQLPNNGKGGDGELRLYCSRECFSEDRKKGEIKVCLNCGKEFYNNICPSELESKKNPGLLCSTKCRLEYYKGEKRYWVWQGGVSPISHYIRHNTRTWVKEVLKENNYTCYISGETNCKLTAHHIKPFHKIRDEILNELGLDKNSNIGECSIEEYEKIMSMFNEKHTVKLGIAIKTELHIIFHRLYGNKATYDDLLEFKQRYKNGEFKQEAS